MKTSIDYRNKLHAISATCTEGGEGTFVASSEAKRVFSTSISWYIVLGFCLFAFFLILGIGGLRVGSYGPVDEATPFIISAGEFYIAYRTYSFQVRKAQFCDTEVEILRGQARIRFAYSQIRLVASIKEVWFYPAVVIHLIGEKDPITILGNPRNSALDVDLYNWLMRKRQKTSTNLHLKNAEKV